MAKHFWVDLLFYHYFDVFEKRTHVLDDLKLAMQPRIILNSQSFGLYLLRSEIVSLCFHALLEWLHWVLRMA
jgi:hypothetical protein